MVTDKGQLKVLDFGIAQSLSTPKTQFDNTMIQTDLEKKPSLTQQGSLVGTIRYMSPEQAQGQVIETPSDMYALGIIAQEIFTHQNAYEISEKAQLLTDVQQGRKQAINGLPSAIINLLDQLTTLNPTDRPTALQCVERINTIINAPTVKRKKIMVIGAITVGLLLLFVLIWQWQQRQHQTIINKQVQQYEAQIEALTTKAEQIYVLPIHPVNAEISAVLQQGDALYQKILNDDKLSNTAKSRLQGIIMLKVEYFSEAITLLKNGQAENQLMADAWVRLYIEKATEYSELHGFEQTMKDENLQNNYLRPALKYIELAEQDSGQTDPLYHAFILSQTQSFDAGLTAINKLLETERWNKDAVNLKALILYAMMAHAQEQGEWQLAKDYALLTAATYHRSTEMARSYPPSYNSLCLTYLNLLSDAIQRSGVDVKLFTNQSISACKNSLITQPNNSYPKHLLSRIFLLKALWQIDSGINADESLTQAQHWSDQTNALSELYIRNWNQALILTIQSKQQLFKGQSAEPTLTQALKILDQLLKVQTEQQSHVASDMIFTLSVLTQNLMRHGTNTQEVQQRAQQIYDQTMLSENLMISEQTGLINNMAQIYWLELFQLFHQDQNILPKAEQLLAFLNPAENLQKKDPLQLVTLANTHLMIAAYNQRQQQTTTFHLNRAENFLNLAQQINPNNPALLLSLGTLQTLESSSGDMNYVRANRTFSQAINNSNNIYSHNSWAQALIIQAQYSQNKIQQDQALETAHLHIEQALSIDPNNQVFIHTQSKLQALAAELSSARD